MRERPPSTEYASRDDDVCRDHAGDGGSGFVARSRRSVLSAAGFGLLAGLAGCSGILGGGDAMSGPNSTTGNTPSPSPTPLADPPETHVTGLQVESEGSTFSFIVTLVAAPDPGGALGWDVESLDAERIHRVQFDERKPGKSTSSSEFEMPDDVDGVVVRGRGRYAGFGGKVILLEPGPGNIALERQGEKRSSFEGYSF